MDPLTRRRLIRFAAYVSSIATGLSVVLTPALLLELRDPEPSGSAVLVVLALAAVVAAFLGRATYRGVVEILGDTSSD
jgi:uncharacterized membrane protein